MKWWNKAVPTPTEATLVREVSGDWIITLTAGPRGWGWTASRSNPHDYINGAIDRYASADDARERAIWIIELTLEARRRAAPPSLTVAYTPKDAR